MSEQISTSPTASQRFESFAKLPIELQCNIWMLAAQYRPRTIQIGYDPEIHAWKACKASSGGLPSIVHVSRAARAEALKPYTRAFDAYIDLERDTILISDPSFSIRRIQKLFMDGEHTKKLSNVAFTDEVFDQLATAFEDFPEIIQPPGSMLRKLEGLKHLSLVIILGEGASLRSGDESDSGTDDDSDGTEEEQDLQNTIEGEAVDLGQGVTTTAVANAAGAQTITYDYNNAQGDTLDINRVIINGSDLAVLSQLEDEYFRTMGKSPYFRHSGNIHLTSAMSAPEHWDHWEAFTEALDACADEKDLHSEWIRPMMSNTFVTYGLSKVGDYMGEIHALGDHDRKVVEKGGVLSFHSWDGSDEDFGDELGDEYLVEDTDDFVYDYGDVYMKSDGQQRRYTLSEFLSL